MRKRSCSGGSGGCRRGHFQSGRRLQIAKLSLLFLALGLVTSAPSTPASLHHNCEDCVEAGWGWCPHERLCGGFQNTECSGTITDYQRSKAAQKKYLAKQGRSSRLLQLSLSHFGEAIEAHPWVLVHFHSSAKSANAETQRALKVLDECASRLANEGHPGKVAAYTLSGSQEEVRFLAQKEVFFGGATATYAFHRGGRKVVPFLGEMQIDQVLEFIRAGPLTSQPETHTAASTKQEQSDRDVDEKNDAVRNESVQEIKKSTSRKQKDVAALNADHGVDSRQAAAKNLVKELSMSTASAATKSHIKLQVLVCADFSSADKHLVTGALTEAAVRLDGKFLFLYLDAKDESNAPIMKRVGGDLNSCPTVRVADTRQRGFVVYQPANANDALPGGRYAYDTADGLVKLAHDYEARQLRRVLNSEPRPDKLTQPVARIVGSMFNETVMNTPGDVLLYLYMDGCPHCKQFTEIYKKVALELRSTDTNGVTLVSMRGTRNDIDHDRIVGSSYPRVYLFARGEKETPYEYRPTGDSDGVMSTDHFKDFIEVYSSYDIVWWDDFVKRDIQQGQTVREGTSSSQDEL